jgi:pSer/pThr/pTyr-binding forkhead associated (FHA) protein
MDGGILIMDLNSDNGTYVDGEKIEAMAGWRLEHGSTMEFADSQLQFVLSTKVCIHQVGQLQSYCCRTYSVGVPKKCPKWQ